MSRQRAATAAAATWRRDVAHPRNRKVTLKSDAARKKLHRYGRLASSDNIAADERWRSSQLENHCSPMRDSHTLGTNARGECAPIASFDLSADVKEESWQVCGNYYRGIRFWPSVSS